MKKMKRLLVAFLSCLTAISCIAGIAACGDKEGNKESSKPQSESSIVPPPASETPVDSDIKTPDASETPESPKECDHVMVWHKEKAATCVEAGHAAYWGCEKCSYGDPTPAKPNMKDYVGFGAAGLAQYNADLEIYEDYLDKYMAAGHVWADKATKEVKADCCNDGVKAYFTCVNCDAVALSNAIDAPAVTAEDLVIPANGAHTYIEGTYVEAIEVTCTTDGRTEGWECKNGGSAVSETISALGHDEIFTVEDVLSAYTEAEAEAIYGKNWKADWDKVKHSKAATCTTQAYCFRANCTAKSEAGIKGYYGELVDHELESVGAQAVTCVADGWNDYEYCVNCGYTTFKAIKAGSCWTAITAEKDWKWEDGVVEAVKKADVACGDEYIDVAHYICDCGLARTSKTATTAKTLEDLTKVKDHTWSKKVAAEAATCLTDGMTEHGTCKECGEVEGEVIPAFGHDYIDIAAGETETSVITNKYGELLEEDDYYVTTINGVEYKFANKASKLANCTDDAVCGICNKKLNEETTFKAATKDSEKIVAYEGYTRLGHTWVEVDEVYASCTENGVKAHYECEVCEILGLVDEKEYAEGKEPKYNYNDNVDKMNKVSATSLVITKHGHAFAKDENGKDIIVDGKKATHVEAGWEAYKECIRCSYSTFKAIEPLKSHNAPAIKTCSAFVTCATIYATVDVNEDGVIDINDVKDVNKDGEINELDYVHVGCGEAYATPKAWKVACKYDAETGVCTVCANACVHSWKAGKCSVCKMVCAHELRDVDGICVVCADVCAHRYAGAESNCIDCGACRHAHVSGYYCLDCGKTIHTHNDADNNHKCDTCTKVVSNCIDENKDCVCDICGDANAHVDNDDHKCDICGATASVCADENNDHKCDICGATTSPCADADNDHNCDLCGEAVSVCVDAAGNDHKCDICEVVMSECADEDKNHKCDVCGETLTECADEDKDHNCDVCGSKMSGCVDRDNDCLCDTCEKNLCKDADSDGFCDNCGEKMLVLE